MLLLLLLRLLLPLPLLSCRHLASYDAKSIAFADDACSDADIDAKSVNDAAANVAADKDDADMNMLNAARHLAFVYKMMLMSLLVALT